MPRVRYWSDAAICRAGDGEKVPIPDTAAL